MTELVSNDGRLQNLIRKLLDEEIGDVETRELSDLLRDNPAAMDEYLSFLLLDAELSWEFGCGPLPLGEQPTQAETPVSRTRTLPKRTKRVMRVTWTTVSLVMIFVLVVMAFRFGEEARPFVAGNLTLDFLAGEFQIINEGQVIQPKVGMRLSRNIDITAHGPTSVARFAYDDGSRVLIFGETLTEFSGNEEKKLQVQRGSISAKVMSQHKGGPMLVTTPHARLEVLDTDFSLAASAEKTDVQVIQGSVRLTRIADGQTIVVPQGCRVEATALVSELTIRDIAPVPGSWEEDFEEGRSASWESGTFVNSGLPPGSHGAIQAELDSANRIYVVASPHPWMDPLFVVQADTHLHITYKMSRPDWINVFFITRTPDPNDPTTSLYKFNELPNTPLDAGRWRTATIPLRDFDRKTEHGFEPSELTRGELVFGISWSAPEPDRGLVIDRIWVTEEGPGKFVIHDAD